MFSFGFSGDGDAEDQMEHKNELQWDSAKEIFPCRNNTTPVDTSTYNIKSADGLKLIPCDEALKLISQNNGSIAEAESLHSDLVPAKYEGGLKVWECTEELANYLAEEKILDQYANSTVLDLGCGAGILGILAMQQGATVHFQDYNEEVLRYLTYINVSLNTKQEARDSCCYFSGDWQSFAELDNRKYDLILTSETIYNSDCHAKLLSVFKNKLADKGIIFLAAKTYYFGVGGGLRQFETLLQNDATLQSSVVWKCSEGVQREILKIQRR